MTLKIYPLYSSSSGNMFNIETPNTNLLIDVGVSYKGINQGLESINKNINDISAILITHEHSDHIKGLEMLCKKNNIPVYACGKTSDYLCELLKRKDINADIRKINYNQPFKVNDIEITAFETSHDAIMPCGYNLRCMDKSITYATDLGFISDEVMEYLKNSDYNILEANYDKVMLDFGKYPFELKRRIKSNLGHLSNDDTANAIAALSKNGVNNYILAHLSENNNNEMLARSTILDTLNQKDALSDNINLAFASKTLSSEVYTL